MAKSRRTNLVRWVALIIILAAAVAFMVLGNQHEPGMTQVATVKGSPIYVGHYNPWKPRSEAADRRVQGIGGNLEQFRAGQIHHMALEVPIDDFFMGGIVNKYFGQTTDPLFWAVWTNDE